MPLSCIRRTWSRIASASLTIALAGEPDVGALDERERIVARERAEPLDRVAGDLGVEPVREGVVADSCGPAGRSAGDAAAVVERHRCALACEIVGRGRTDASRADDCHLEPCAPFGERVRTDG